MTGDNDRGVAQTVEFLRAGPLPARRLAAADLRALWANWFQARFERRRATDGDMRHAIVRLAADGIWLADLAATACRAPRDDPAARLNRS